MSKIGLISDSTCDLPEAIIKENNIGLIPVNVIFDNTEVRQPYFDLTNEEFYRRLIAGERVTSGVPSPGIVKQYLEKSLKNYDELLIITLSSKLSAVHQTVKLVVDSDYKDKVTLVDSLSGTIETGLVVLIAARELAKGKTRKEVAKYLEQEIIPEVHLISYAATLKYLRRSGRISRLTHLMGKVLNIKPIFHIDKGEIVSPGKIMLWQNIDLAFKKLLAQVAGKQKIETAFIAHSGNPEKCQELIDYFKSLPNAPKEILMAEVGPAVGVHVGPDTFGFVWVGKYSDDWFKDL
ncbi:MAG: DegV family protein [Candidatus Thorarchaeota archaeon]